MKVYTPIDYIDGDGYIPFTAEEAVPSFSFEHPSDYDLWTYQPMPEFPSTSVMLSDIDLSYKEDIAGCPPPETEWDYKRIRVYIHRVNEDAPGAETEVNERIAEYEQLVIEGYAEDFRLLEKNRVIIAGLEGWEIVISHTSLPVIHPDDPCPRTRAVLVISRELFFDYQDTVWRVSVFSDAGNSDQAELDYEHILGTLRILE